MLPDNTSGNDAAYDTQLPTMEGIVLTDFLQLDMTLDGTSKIENRVRIAIADHPHLQNMRFHFKTREGQVTLKGSVDSWYEMQMAQEALRNIDGVSKIENELTVLSS